MTNYFLLKCPQFKHLNLCLNKINDESMGLIQQVLSQTPDDFGMTLSGNQISGPVIERIQNAVKSLHRQRVQDLRMADASNAAMQELEDIGQRRAAF